MENIRPEYTPELPDVVELCLGRLLAERLRATVNRTMPAIVIREVNLRFRHEIFPCRIDSCQSVYGT
jgi:hypothetical protein